MRDDAILSDFLHFCKIMSIDGEAKEEEET